MNTPALKGKTETFPFALCFFVLTVFVTTDFVAVSFFFQETNRDEHHSNIVKGSEGGKECRPFYLFEWTRVTLLVGNAMFPPAPWNVSRNGSCGKALIGNWTHPTYLSPLRIRMKCMRITL
jgi:hypothetical protein